jgi:hypothetical protein
MWRQMSCRDREHTAATELRPMIVIQSLSFLGAAGFRGCGHKPQRVVSSESACRIRLQLTDDRSYL